MKIFISASVVPTGSSQKGYCASLTGAFYVKKQVKITIFLSCCFEFIDINEWCISLYHRKCPTDDLAPDGV